MKKIDKTQNWLKMHLTMFRCPVCGQPFMRVENYQMICQNQHTININKHGYVYFLTRGVASEYDKPMLLARRSLLKAGLFRGILEAINQSLPHDPQRILDVGTGEGTPLDQLRQLRQQSQDTYVGFDISRAGVQLATELSEDLFFCLADLRKLPFSSHSFHTIIELFSPSDYQEFRRVLNPDGVVYKVVPTNNYLRELRNLLYPENDQHRQYDNSSVKQLFAQHFPNHRVENIRYRFTVPEDLRMNLVQMSPLHWGKQARQLSQEDLKLLKEVTVDVDILQGKLK